MTTRARPAPRERERKPRRSGWLRVVFGLLALALAGFATGMVAGIAFQDPGLAWAYVAGETEEVVWTANGGTPREPDAEAAEPVVDPQVRREHQARAEPPDRGGHPVQPEPASRGVTPADVAAAPAGGLAVQVGAFGTSRAAEELARSLRAKDYQAKVTPGTQSGAARWRVRVGPFATRAAAEEAADRLKRVEKLPTWILSEGAD